MAASVANLCKPGVLRLRSRLRSYTRGPTKLQVRLRSINLSVIHYSRGRHSVKYGHAHRSSMRTRSSGCTSTTVLPQHELPHRAHVDSCAARRTGTRNGHGLIWTRPLIFNARARSSGCTSAIVLLQHELPHRAHVDSRAARRTGTQDGRGLGCCFGSLASALRDTQRLASALVVTRVAYKTTNASVHNNLFQFLALVLVAIYIVICKGECSSHCVAGLLQLPLCPLQVGIQHFPR